MWPKKTIKASELPRKQRNFPVGRKHPRCNPPLPTIRFQRNDGMEMVPARSGFHRLDSTCAKVAYYFTASPTLLDIRKIYALTRSDFVHRLGVVLTPIPIFKVRVQTKMLLRRESNPGMPLPKSRVPSVLGNRSPPLQNLVMRK